MAAVEQDILVGGFIYASVLEGLTAKAGGGRVGAVPIAAMINRFTTVANAADSAVLPVARRGLNLTVINAGANPMQVFAVANDTIDSTAGATGYSQANRKSVVYVCTKDGAWHKVISA